MYLNPAKEKKGFQLASRGSGSPAVLEHFPAYIVETRLLARLPARLPLAFACRRTLLCSFSPGSLHAVVLSRTPHAVSVAGGSPSHLVASE